MSITLWTKPDCGPCKAVKRKFDGEGIHYDERDITAPRHAAKLAEFKAAGRLQTPIVETAAETFSGYQPDKIQAVVDQARAEQAHLMTSAMAGPGPMTYYGPMP